MNQTPTIVAEVTFLSPEEGGRTQATDLSSGSYRPHLVVQHPDVRPARPAAVAGGQLTGDYLGVCFLQGPAEYATGRPLRCLLALMYHPQVDYTALQTGATFTLREGPHVVGFGTVLSRTEPTAIDGKKQQEGD